MRYGSPDTDKPHASTLLLKEQDIMAYLPHKRRVYFDHENVYRKFRERGYKGWTAPDDTGKLGACPVSGIKPRAISGKALDLGCGGGEASIFLAQSGWQVVGIDYSETAIAMAWGKCPGFELACRISCG